VQIGMRLSIVFALSVTPLGLSVPTQASEPSVPNLTHQAEFQSASSDVLNPTSRSRPVPPRFSWKTENLDISRLSGLPLEVGLTFDRSNRPWVGLHLNEGLDKGRRVVVTSPQGNSWTAPQDLGPAWNESGLSSATSPTGAAFTWRSAENTLTLARLTRATWEVTSVTLPPEWFEDHWGRTGPVQLPNLTYLLTVSQRTEPFGTGFAITWPEGSPQASVTRFQAPEDLAGRWPPNAPPAWTVWISNASEITVAYFKTNAAAPPQRGDVVITKYNPAATQWSSPELAISGVVEVYTLQHVTRTSGDVLILGSKDNRFGQIPQVEIVRHNGSAWTNPSIIENTDLYPVTAPVASGSICIITGNSGWTYDVQGNLRKFAGIRSRTTQPHRQQVTPRLWARPVAVFQTQRNACVSTEGRRLSVVGEGYSAAPGPPKGGMLGGIAISSDTTGAVDTTPNRVRYSTLEYQMPQAPGSVTNLRIDKRTRTSTTVTWDPPQTTPYPNALYQVRIVTPGNPGKWGRNISHRKIAVSTPRPDVRYTIQVKAVNVVGESSIRSIQFTS